MIGTAQIRGPLLPPNATAFERAFEDATAARASLPVHLVRDVMDPDRCPADYLGFLAWHYSIDLWDDDWPETKKRNVCRNALALHRGKTTLAGIRAHLDLVDVKLVRAIRPPARGFMRGAMTDAQRAAWRDDLPQIRLYPFAHRAIAPRAHGFYTGPGARRQFHGGGSFAEVTLAIGTGDGIALGGLSGEARSIDAPATPVAFHRRSRGPMLYGRRATFHDRGEEQDVAFAHIEGGTVTRVFLANSGSRRSWHGRGFGTGFLTRSRAELGIVTIRADDNAQALAATRGMQPVDVRPQRIAQPRIAPAPRAFFGRQHHGRGGFLMRSAAPLFLYDRIALHVPERMGARRRALSWHGHDRFGIDPYSSELKLAVPMRRPRRRSGRWHRAGFRKAADMTALAKAIEAVGVSKALRDTIRLDTTNHRRAAFASDLQFGDFTFGQLRKV
ncbi:phage tail protein I [Croceicoccus sp. YJ47]|uniref:phage tail protein I n=1 Tax=Croceicoccus sp. YJ47 TaxID=2798724 RepID=UPI0019216AF3|nr:phage tail protein I [Croceicoccus sp. YJ47]QQN73171.1 phage tail protein I [Croceicoccus sp. YJ47]